MIMLVELSHFLTLEALRLKNIDQPFERHFHLSFGRYVNKTPLPFKY